MKIGKFKVKLKTIIIILVFLFIIYWLYGIVTSYVKKSNIYNIETMDFKDIEIQSQALVVFDEYVYDIFDNTKLNIDSNRIIRNGEGVDETISVSANSNATDIENYLKSTIPQPAENDTQEEDEKDEEEVIKPTKSSSKDDLVSSIQRNSIKELNLDFLDSINVKKSHLLTKQKEVDEFIKNKIVALEKSGYLSNKLDGYETILNSDTLDEIEADYFTIKTLEDQYIDGLKYVNNKKYQLLVKLDDYDRIKDFNFSDITIKLNNEPYLVSKYNIKRDKYDNVYIIFDMFEGLEKLKDKRLVDITIHLDRINSLKVPSKSIFKKDGQLGVYTIMNGIVRFAPVKVIYEQDNISYIRHQKADIFTKAYLDLVYMNNTRFNNDSDNPNYINIYELKEFSKIILDPNSVKEGDTY
ncbi:MAG: hypothetical protein GXY87_00185 [Tissierellia bacterium]|nr:hypothetical protein [Tissierellia bacterium]